jgi:hypothetical protein
MFFGGIMKYKIISKDDGSERIVDEKEVRRLLEGAYIDLELAIKDLEKGAKLTNGFSIIEKLDKE